MKSRPGNRRQPKVAESSERYRAEPRLGVRKPGPKRSANVSIDAEILSVAKDLKINLSQTLEDELRRLTREERIRRFQEEHREAIEAHNRFIEKHGIWSQKYRSW
jgi:antitoxin CcdA